MLSVRKTALAEQDLIDIWLYSFHMWSEEQADFYLDDLGHAIDLLAKQPLICRERTDLSPSVRIHHHNKHLIVYTVGAHEILVVRVLHDSMDIQVHISD